jgi:hypothetical protein
MNRDRTGSAIRQDVPCYGLYPTGSRLAKACHTLGRLRPGGDDVVPHPGAPGHRHDERRSRRAGTKTGTLTFSPSPGETTKTITIEVKGDSKKEADETFYLDLFGNSGNSLITKNRGLGTILNDD